MGFCEVIKFSGGFYLEEVGFWGVVMVVVRYGVLVYFAFYVVFFSFFRNGKGIKLVDYILKLFKL